jgi:hypothetical protein
LLGGLGRASPRCRSRYRRTRPPDPEANWADFLDARKARLGDVLEDIGTKVARLVRSPAKIGWPAFQALNVASAIPTQRRWTNTKLTIAARVTKIVMSTSCVGYITRVMNIVGVKPLLAAMRA